MILLPIPHGMMDVFWVDNSSWRPEISPYIATWVENTRGLLTLGIVLVPGMTFNGKERIHNNICC